MDGRGRLGSGRQGAGVGGVGQRVEEGRRHLRPPRVVGAGEDHGRHIWPRAQAARSAGLATGREIADRAGTSQRKSAVASAAPRSCATMKLGTSAGRMPAKVSVSARAMVTAGLAKDVEAVNQ